MPDQIESVYVDDEDRTVFGPWTIATTVDLDWALSRLGALEAEMASLQAQVTAAEGRLRERADYLTAKIHHGVMFFRAKIEEHAVKNRESLLGGGKKKSRALLNGTVGWRKTQGKLEVLDKQAFLAWLERHPKEAGLYSVRIVPIMDALKDHYLRTKSIPPGCQWVDETDSFYVTAHPLDGLAKGDK
jgi:phage host-nuclease inhibitor protein Gam